VISLHTANPQIPFSLLCGGALRKSIDVGVEICDISGSESDRWRKYEEWIKQEAEQDDKIKDTEIERIEKDIEEEVKGEVDTEEIPDWVTEKQEGETEEIPNEVITKTREDGFAAGSIEEKKQTAKNLFNFLEEGDIVERDREIVEKDASGNYVEKTITDTGKVVIEDGRKIVKGTISGGSRSAEREIRSPTPTRSATNF